MLDPSGKIGHRGSIQLPHVGELFIFPPDRLLATHVNVSLRSEHVCVSVG